MSTDCLPEISNRDISGVGHGADRATAREAGEREGEESRGGQEEEGGRGQQVSLSTVTSTIGIQIGKSRKKVHTILNDLMHVFMHQ